MHNTPPIVLLAALLLLTACKSTQHLPQTATGVETIYQQAIQDAMSPAPSKVCNNLVAITPQNQDLTWKSIEGEAHVLVVTWKQSASYYEPYLDSAHYNTGNYPIWVTTAPELLNRLKKESPQDPSFRLKQLLGLPPKPDYHYFVEFWVRPQDLFRPCPDPEVTDRQCDLCFPEKTDSAHITWVNGYRLNSYYPCHLYKKYPWTQLGYTYDWNPQNTTHFGLSEFVVAARKNIVVEAVYTTEEYLQKNSKND